MISNLPAIAVVSIHAPREGERPHTAISRKENNYVSIHAPREGERHHATYGHISIAGFQSTLPARGSDKAISTNANVREVSIHAPREGERLFDVEIAPIYWGFNPRSPRGGATVILPMLVRHRLFQSTLPARGSDKRT